MREEFSMHLFKKSASKLALLIVLSTQSVGLLASNAGTDQSDPNPTLKYLQGSWSYRLEECKRPYWTFSPSLLHEKTDGDGTPIQYKFPIERYYSSDDAMWVEFNNDPKAKNFKYPKDPIKLRKLSEVEMELYVPRPINDPSWVRLKRCPTKAIR